MMHNNEPTSDMVQAAIRWLTRDGTLAPGVYRDDYVMRSPYGPAVIDAAIWAIRQDAQTRRRNMDDN